MNTCSLIKLKAIALLTLLAASGCSTVLHPIGGAECAPVYGNWCGENYPLTGFEPRPVDAWDRACRKHDKCYESGKSKDYCDEYFVAELEELSYQHLAPQEMHNAHSWFRKDGWLGGGINLLDEAWSISASCEGGDGRAAEFYCALNQFNGCWLNPTISPGRAGMPCSCGMYPGIIVEK
ncbi:MAG: hypothetical protein ABW166_09910 [Sedimenticola sp.]